MKVAIYFRESGTRKYKPASPRAMYPASVTFCLRYTREGKRRWEQLSVSTYKEAQAVSLKRLSELITESCQEESLGAKISRNLALPAPRSKPQPIAQIDGLMLDAAIDKYLENVATKSSKTSSGYCYTLQQFYASTGNSLLSSVTTQQLYDFVGYLRREGLGDRTIHNRVGEVVTFLRHFGIKEVTIRVKYVEQKVRAYRPDELRTLFAAADDEETLLFQFFLCTGAREQEVMHGEWSDIDFVDGLFTVKAKEHWNPKDYEEREIPLPDFLVAALKKRMLTTNGKLIFPNLVDGEQRPDGHMLRKLKYLAKRAGLKGEFKLHRVVRRFISGVLRCRPEFGNPDAIARDLPHRGGRDWGAVASRIGWLTWEDCEAVLPGSCKWIAMEANTPVERNALSQRTQPVLAVNLPYTLVLNFDKARLEKLITEFESSAKRGIDRSLALKLRSELLESEPPYVSRATILQLAKRCKTNSPLYWDGMEVARKISQLLFGCVVDRDALDV